MENPDKDLDVYAELIEKLFQQLSRLPKPLVEQIQSQLNDLISFIKDQRSPRFMLIGRRGSGKSSLINAIFCYKIREVGSTGAMTGPAKWESYKRDSKEMEILDTRGLREGGKPVEYDPAKTPIESILNAVNQRCPDAVLFVCKAKEVDAGIQDDLNDLEEILQGIEKNYGSKLPIVGVISQCDELDPPKVNLPTDNQKKNDNIKKTVALFQKYFLSRNYLKGSLVQVIPVVSYAEYNADKTLDKNQDYRWNIESLEGLLLEKLPKEAKVQFARITGVRKFQKQVASSIVDLCAGVCGVVGLTPFPGTDIPIIIGIQVTMVIIVAYISGRELSYQTALQFFLGLGMGRVGGILLQEVAGFILGFLPVLGNITAAALDVWATQVVGRAAIAYFLDDTPINKVKQQLEQDKEQLRSSFK